MGMQLPKLMQKAIENSATNNQVNGGGVGVNGGGVGVQVVKELMEIGSVFTGPGNGKASDSRSVVLEIEVDKLLEHYGEGNEKPVIIKVPDPEKGSRSSLVVEIEKMLEDTKPSVLTERWKRHSIYRVPQFMKRETNCEAYSPQFVSLGPLHHGEHHLQPMEEHKRRAVLHMVNRSGKPLEDFQAAIDKVADKLQAAYMDLDDKWRGANKGCFVDLMVTDGCFLLEWIRAAQESEVKPEESSTHYVTKDPIFSNHSILNLLPTMRKDMICMENQIPLLVLKKLLAVQRGTSVEPREINSMVVSILDGPVSSKQILDGKDLWEGTDKLGLHFLDIYHKMYCGKWERSAEVTKDEPRKDPQKKEEPRRPSAVELSRPCAVELSESGILFSQSNTESIHEVKFEHGVLTMPQFIVDDYTEARLLNLMAFEWLHHDANFFVRSYISFLDKLIMSERDAKLLRSQGLVANSLGSDKKLVKMFNTLTYIARKAMPESELGHVMSELHQYCKNPQHKWRAIFMNDYFSNPWVITSMVAAFILLVAALLQTVYTVLPFYTKG